MKFLLYTDGGARGNPGPAAIGVVLKNNKGEVVRELSSYIGVGTNNDAEYKALVEGLTLSTLKEITELEVFLDSELIVKQLKGLYKVKNERLKKYYLEVKILEKNFSKVTYKHIKRHLNKEADDLVNKALDVRI